MALFPVRTLLACKRQGPEGRSTVAQDASPGGRLPATMTIAKAMQLIKAGSSRFVKETFAHRRRFAWQEGYGAFTVSISVREKTIRYIHHQEKHHKRRTFQEEFLEFLQTHGIEYDPRHVWG